MGDDLAAARELAPEDDSFAAEVPVLHGQLEEASERLRRNDVIHATLQTLGEAADSAVSNAAGCFVAVQDGWGGTFRTIAAPIRFPEGAPAVGRAAPKLGQHTAEVLAGAGFTEAQIADLLATGAVRGPA
mgnify:CR=1 FL=1